jgi:hypothetical protein
MTSNAHIAHEADNISNAVSRISRQISPHLSASAAGVTAVGIVTGTIEYQDPALSRRGRGQRRAAVGAPGPGGQPLIAEARFFWWRPAPAPPEESMTGTCTSSRHSSPAAGLLPPPVRLGFPPGREPSRFVRHLTGFLNIASHI